jgi:hypothetical protein
MTVFAGAPVATAGSPCSVTVNIDQAFFDGIVEPFEELEEFFYYVLYSPPDWWDPETLYFENGAEPDSVRISLGGLSAETPSGSLPPEIESFFLMVQAVFFLIEAVDLENETAVEDFLATVSDPSSYPLIVDFVFVGSTCTVRFGEPNRRSRNPIDLDHYLDRAEAGALPNTL